MSGFLFLLVVDWIMRRTISEGKAGIKWRMMEQLEDLDYADDIVLISETLHPTGVSCKHQIVPR